ncbi:hypothetical protein ANCDUO_25820, partial [Ancylostoma duodenale]
VQTFCVIVAIFETPPLIVIPIKQGKGRDTDVMTSGSFMDGRVPSKRFFVISGFLIAMILRRSDNLDMEAFRSFYYRRMKRILPLYYLAIACILIALFLLLPTSYRSMNIDSSRRAIILISNIKKVDVDANYQKMLVNAEDLFTHTWSLCVEMQ